MNSTRMKQFYLFGPKQESAKWHGDFPEQLPPDYPNYGSFKNLSDVENRVPPAVSRSFQSTYTQGAPFSDSKFLAISSHRSEYDLEEERWLDRLKHAECACAIMTVLCCALVAIGVPLLVVWIVSQRDSN